MTSMRTAVLIAIGLIIALGWAVMPPQPAPRTALPLALQKNGQCPPGATLHEKLCVCPGGTHWSGAACVRH